MRMMMMMTIRIWIYSNPRRSSKSRMRLKFGPRMHEIVWSPGLTPLGELIALLDPYPATALFTSTLGLSGLALPKLLTVPTQVPTHMELCTPCFIIKGSAATDSRWGCRFYSSLLCSSSENAAVKELLKLVNIWLRNDENMKRMYFMKHPAEPLLWTS